MTYSVGDHVIVQTAKLVPGTGVHHHAYIEEIAISDEEYGGTNLYLVRYERRRLGIFTLREWVRGWDLKGRVLGSLSAVERQA